MLVSRVGKDDDVLNDALPGVTQQSSILSFIIELSIDFMSTLES